MRRFCFVDAINPVAVSVCPTSEKPYFPTLSPNPFLAPPGEKGGPTAVFGREFKVDEFLSDGNLDAVPTRADQV